MGLEEQPPALSALLLDPAPSSLGKAWEEQRVLGSPVWGSLGDPSFSLPTSSSEAEPCRDVWDSEPVWVAGGCAAVCLPSSAHPQGQDQAPCWGLMGQVVLLRWGLGLQIQVLQTLASLQEAEPKPWIPPSQKFGSGAKGDSWPLLPT